MIFHVNLSWCVNKFLLSLVLTNIIIGIASSNNISSLIKVPAAFDRLTNSIKATMRHAIEVEEKIPMDSVTNIEEV